MAKTSSSKTVFYQTVIANPCKWCDGAGWKQMIFSVDKCDHCQGTGDHDYRTNNNVVTYRRLAIGRIITTILVLFLLVGCNSVKHAKADKIRAATRRQNDIHQQRMTEARATAPTRIAARQTLVWVGTFSGIVVMVAGSVALGFYLMGLSYAKVRYQVAIQTIPLDRDTRQLPLIVYRSGRYFNPNTGHAGLLSSNSDPYPQLAQGVHAVQLAGALPAPVEAAGLIERVTNER